MLFYIPSSITEVNRGIPARGLLNPSLRKMGDPCFSFKSRKRKFRRVWTSMDLRGGRSRNPVSQLSKYREL